jgi:murein DD-endopeptidase MepM/ murein hydrolase activator NlpD
MNEQTINGMQLSEKDRKRDRQGQRLLCLGRLLSLAILAGFVLAGCQPMGTPQPFSASDTEAVPEIQVAEEPAFELPTPFPTRPSYAPAELVDYTAQGGDTLAVLAIRFNTTVEEILEANDFIPPNATTMPPGMPMRIPIYYQPFWGSPYQVIPDSVFVNGPSQVGFDTQAFVESQPGWLNGYSDYVAGRNRSGAEIVDYVAGNFSVSPQLLLALLEYQAGALSQAELPAVVDREYMLGYEDVFHKGMYLQLIWAANMLNHGYYRYRTGQLETIYFPDGTIENIDPWQNAATAALQYYFSENFSREEYLYGTGSEGLARAFRELFGDPWQDVQPHLPGSLEQPLMQLPFEAGKTWAYTGGPHTGWGTGKPWAAVDFAPPSTASGCIPSNEWATAVADGVVARIDEGILELDLDGDGDSRTGWVVFYLHVAARERVAAGTVLQAGQRIGHPSCEGGTSTGTHIHIARKYNGEWIPADGILSFNLDGWIAHNGDGAYSGTLTRFNETVVANTNANQASYVTAEKVEE